MKLLFLVAFIYSLNSAFAVESSISGKIATVTGCSKKVMVWLSLDKENYHERLLLLHTEVPQGGTYRFFVKPGNYQVRATDEAGCEFLERVNVRIEDKNVPVTLVKK